MISQSINLIFNRGLSNKQQSIPTNSTSKHYEPMQHGEIKSI